MATGLIANGNSGSTGPLITYTPQSNAKVSIVLSSQTNGAVLNVNGASYGVVTLSSYYYGSPTETHIYVAGGSTITFQGYSNIQYCISALEEQT